MSNPRMQQASALIDRSISVERFYILCSHLFFQPTEILDKNVARDLESEEAESSFTLKS